MGRILAWNYKRARFLSLCERVWTRLRVVLVVCVREPIDVDGNSLDSLTRRHARRDRI